MDGLKAFTIIRPDEQNAEISFRKQMENNQILIVTVIIVIVIFILILFGWSWYSDQPSSKYPDCVAKSLHKVKHIMDDQVNYMRMYIIEVALNSDGQDVTKEKLAELYFLSSKEIFNGDEVKAQKLADLWVAKLALLKRLHDGEAKDTIETEWAEIDAKTVALLTCSGNGNVGGGDALKTILEAYRINVVQQLVDYQNKDYKKSLLAYTALKTANKELFDWTTWYVLRKAGYKN